MTGIPPHVVAVLDAVAASALQSVPGAAAATITVMSDDDAVTAACTSAWAVRVDAAQHLAGRGPCVDAALGGQPREVPDTAVETRWPHFVAAALAGGALSTLSIPIPVDDAGVVGSLNVFGATPFAFAAQDQDRLTRLAGTAAAALTTVGTGAGPTRARAVVDQAKGIVMTAEHCTPSRALDSLNRRAQTAGLSLRQVATDVVRESAP